MHHLATRLLRHATCRCVQGVFAWLDGRPAPGKEATLLYNRDASELRHRKELMLHLGCNGWANQAKEVYTLARATSAEIEGAKLPGKGDWYSTKCRIPPDARIVDFVISDRERQVRARACAA
jgi:hypothetical protein